MKKSFSKISLFCVVLLTFIVFLSINSFEIKAEKENSVILGGHTIGIKLDTGIYVVGKYEVKSDKNETLSPWKNSDIEIGDKIISFNNKKIINNTELLNELKHINKDSVNLKIERNNKIINTRIDIVNTKESSRSIGLYIKDRLLGIGTMTYIDPNTNKFASLGHGIYDNNVIIGAQKGTINVSSIEGIKKGTRGSAGEKKAIFSNTQLGTVLSNKITGIYGEVTDNDLFKGTKIEIGKQDDVKIGPAKIYTVIDGKKVESFTIRIIDIVKQDSINVKGIKFEVTDNYLLEKTGGIIQGMSGSPIVQNNKLIGAVSHVLIDDPKIGYGVHIEWMQKDICC